MQVVKDAFGNEVNIGDYLVHVSRKSSSIYIHYSLVYGFIWRGNNNVTLKVASVEKSWYGNTYHFYRATLTVDNFVKTSSDVMPEEIVKGLLNTVKV